MKRDNSSSKAWCNVLVPPSVLGIITTDSIPADAADGKEQEEAGAGEPARVAPLENAILVIYSSMYYLTKTVSLTFVFFFSDSMLMVTVFEHEVKILECLYEIPPDPLKTAFEASHRCTTSMVLRSL